MARYAFYCRDFSSLLHADFIPGDTHRTCRSAYAVQRAVEPRGPEVRLRGRSFEQGLRALQVSVRLHRLLNLSLKLSGADWLAAATVSSTFLYSVALL